MITANRRLWLAAYLAALLVLTLAPLPQAADRLAAIDHFDKVVHFVLLGGFAVLLYWNVAVRDLATPLRVVVPAAAVAGLIEVLQAPLPYRTADFWDFFWGVVGAVVGYVIASRLVKPS